MPEVRRIQCKDIEEVICRASTDFGNWEKVSWKMTTKYTLTLRSPKGQEVVLESSESEDNTPTYSLFEEE